MNKKGILFGVFGLALLLDGQILAMNKYNCSSLNLNSSAFMSVSKQKTKNWRKMRNDYLRNLKESNLQLVKEMKFLAEEVQQMRSMLSRKFPGTSNMGVQTSSNRLDIGIQSFNEEESHEPSPSESENQDEQVSDMTTDEENSNINSFPNDELIFLERNLDNIQLGNIDGSVGAQFPITQLDANVLYNDKDLDDPNYFDSMHYYSLKIWGINGSDQRPGSISFSRMTISGTDGRVHDIHAEQDLSRMLVSLVMSAISDRADLEYLRAGLREVGVSI